MEAREAAEQSLRDAGWDCTIAGKHRSVWIRGDAHVVLTGSGVEWYAPYSRLPALLGQATARSACVKRFCQRPPRFGPRPDESIANLQTPSCAVLGGCHLMLTVEDLRDAVSLAIRQVLWYESKMAEVDPGDITQQAIYEVRRERYVELAARFRAAAEAMEKEGKRDGECREALG